MSPVSAGFILIKVSYVLVAEHISYSKKPGGKAAKSAVVFQMVHKEKKNNVFHTESLLENLIYTD